MSRISSLLNYVSISAILAGIGSTTFVNYASSEVDVEEYRGGAAASSTVEEYSSDSGSDVCASDLVASRVEDGQLDYEIMDAADLCDKLSGILTTEAVAKMIQTIDNELPKLALAKDQDITVFMGNTGAGKSTLVNLLGGVRLQLDDGVLLLGPEDSGLVVQEGAESATKYPQHLFSQTSGMLFDLPGFEDSNGAIDDLINAALTRSLLENARGVKAAIVLSQSEIEGSRGRAFKGLMKHINLFSKEFLERSFFLLVNKVDREIDTIDRLKRKLNPYIKDDSLTKYLLERDRVRMIPKVSFDETDVVKFMESWAPDVISQIQATHAQPVVKANMAMTLNTDGMIAFKDFIRLKVTEVINNNIKEKWPREAERVGNDSKKFKGSYKHLISLIRQDLEADLGIKLLKPLGEGLYKKVIEKELEHSGLFRLEFRIFLKELDVKRLEQDAYAKEQRASIERIRSVIDSQQVSGADFGFRPYIDALREVANRHANRKHASLCLSYSPNLEGRSPVQLSMEPLSNDNPEMNLEILKGGINQLKVALHGVIDIGKRNIEQINRFRALAFQSVDIHTRLKNKLDGLTLIGELDHKITEYKNIVGAYSAISSKIDQISAELTR